MTDRGLDHVKLEFRHITKRFPGVTALNDVSFAVLRGHVHAICGENGAGKSTLAGILFGMIAPTQGEIVIEGEPVEIGNPAMARQPRNPISHPGSGFLPQPYRGRQYFSRQHDEAVP